MSAHTEPDPFDRYLAQPDFPPLTEAEGREYELQEMLDGREREGSGRAAFKARPGAPAGSGANLSKAA